MGILNFQDIKSITLKRSRLLKWLTEPFFDSIVAGSFVRVGIRRSSSGRPIYRLCTVRDIIYAMDPYRHYLLGDQRTNKWLNCVWGNEASATRWQIAMVSDREPLEEEYDAWYQEVNWSGSRMPTVEEVNKKKLLIQRLIHAYDRPSPRDANARQTRVAKLKAERALKLAEMNKRNKAENFKNATETKAVDASLKSGDAGYDPFSRRWTRPSNCCPLISRPQSNTIAIGDSTAGSASTAAATVS